MLPLSRRKKKKIRNHIFPPSCLHSLSIPIDSPIAHQSKLPSHLLVAKPSEGNKIKKKPRCWAFKLARSKRGKRITRLICTIRLYSSISSPGTLYCTGAGTHNAELCIQSTAHTSVALLFLATHPPPGLGPTRHLLGGCGSNWESEGIPLSILPLMMIVISATPSGAEFPPYSFSSGKPYFEGKIKCFVFPT